MQGSQPALQSHMQSPSWTTGNLVPLFTGFVWHTLATLCCAVIMCISFLLSHQAVTVLKRSYLSCLAAEPRQSLSSTELYHHRLKKLIMKIQYVMINSVHDLHVKVTPETWGMSSVLGALILPFW